MNDADIEAFEFGDALLFFDRSGLKPAATAALKRDHVGNLQERFEILDRLDGKFVEKPVPAEQVFAIERGDGELHRRSPRILPGGREIAFKGRCRRRMCRSTHTRRHEIP